MKKILDILSCIWTAFLVLALLIFAGVRYIGDTFEEYGEKVRELNKKVEVFNKRPKTSTRETITYSGRHGKD